MQEGVQSASIVAQSCDVCGPWRVRGGVKIATKNRPGASRGRRGGVARGKGLLVEPRALRGLYLAKDSRSISIRRLIARM